MSPTGHGSPERFPTTAWSLVARAGREDSQQRREALGQLLVRYLPALQAHLVYRRRFTPDEADDLIQELGTILEHQLAAPIEPDLSSRDKDLPRKLEAFNATETRPINTFNDLLHHPRPPIELLELTKDFAKACRSHPDSPLPDEIATVLYLGSIVAARTRCDRPISKLGSEGLRHGLDWALSQSWLDQSTRALLEQGRQAVDAAEP